MTDNTRMTAQPKLAADDDNGCAIPPPGYICPACELSVAGEDPETTAIVFFDKPRLLDRPICEVCALELHYLLVYPPLSLYLPPYDVLVKLVLRHRGYAG